MWTANGKRIYTANIVYSVPKNDGKRRLQLEVKAFSSKESAIRYCQSIPDEEGDRRVKIAQVNVIEEVIE